MAGRSQRWRISLALVALLAGSVGAPAPSAAAVVLHVPGDYPTIQAAVDASSDGDTVVVGAGTYAEKVVILAKDIVLESASGPATTIIDGGGLATVVILGPSAGQSPVLRGFTIRNGGISGGSGSDGGGVVTSGGSPIIEGNRIIENASCGGGSGISARFSQAVIRDNLIASNVQSGCTGGSGGGGVFVGGAGAVQVLDNVIRDNANGTFGGGISLFASGFVTVAGNVISHNTASDGGGISLLNDSPARIFNNLISENTAETGGGVSWSVPSASTGPTIFNNTIVGNSGTYGSAVAANGFDSATTLRGNVIVGATEEGTVHCAGSHDEPPIIRSNDVLNTIGLEYTGDCGSQTSTNGNVSVFPRFVDSAAGDYHLRPDSPLIDHGSGGTAPADDIDGDVRPFDGNEDGSASSDPGFDEATDPVLVTPPSANFGSVATGVADEPIVVTVGNFGSDPFTIASVSVGGANAADFAVDAQTCTAAPLASGGSCTVTVGFTPSVKAPRSATLSVVGPAPVGTRTVALTGSGLDQVLVVPPSLAFGEVTVGIGASPLTVTVTNRGATPATVSGVSVGGRHAADFSIAQQSCTAKPVAPSGTCTVSVGFRPRAIGIRGAILSIGGPAPVGTRNYAIGGTGLQPSSGVTWAAPVYAGPAYTWNGGGALARTVRSGSQLLHLGFATDRISGVWATDSGPHVGIYYQRSANGSTWSTPKRLNPSTQHAARLGVAASGSRVYAAWVSQTKVVNYSGTTPRVLYVRVNTNHGSPTAWRTAVRLTTTTGRVDYPTIAASGDYVHIAYTDSVTGSVRVASSRDRGVTWTRLTVGTTAFATTDGKVGGPSIAASGTTVAVAWLADNGGTIKSRVSTDRGVSWGSVTTVGTGSVGGAAVAVRSSRIAVVWTTLDDVVVRQRLAGTWDAPRVIASLTKDAPTVPYAPAVVLQDPSRIAVTWSEAQADLNHSMLRLAESADSGKLWFKTQTLATISADKRAANDWTSVIWPSPDTRYVAWNGWTPGTIYYRLYARKGSGTPIGPTMAAPAWLPSDVAGGGSAVPRPIAPTDLRLRPTGRR